MNKSKCYLFLMLAFSFALLASCQKDPVKTDSMTKEKTPKYCSTLGAALAEVDNLIAQGTPCIKVQREDRSSGSTITGTPGSPSTCYLVSGNNLCPDGTCDCNN